MARKRKSKSMFYENPRHKDLAKIVRLDSPSAAKKAAMQLLNKFKRARTREQKVTIKRSVVLAANRAEAIRKKKNLSSKERKEMKQVAKIYRNAAKKMKLTAILVLLLLTVFVNVAYAAGPPGSSGNDSVSVASNVPTDSITKNELYKLTYYDLYGTQIDFFSVDTYRISYSYSRNFTSYDTYYTNKLNKSVLADHGRFYFKFNASDYKSRQYFKVVYEDGYYSLFDFQFNYTVYNVFVLIDYERSGTFTNLATYPATEFSIIYGSLPTWTNGGFYFNGRTVLATPATVLTQFSLYFKGVIFGRLADKNKIVFQPYSFNFQPLRSDNDGSGLGFRTEIYSTTWMGYWINNVDAYNNSDVFAYMLDTSSNNLKFGIVFANDSGRLEYSTTTAVRNTPKNVIAIGGMPSSTLYCFQGYMKQLIILANSSYDPVQLYRYYNNLSAYYTTQIYLPADTHLNNTIIFTLRSPAYFLYDENKFIADTKTHGRIVKIEFSGLYIYAEIWNGTDAGDFFVLHNIQYFNSINKSYILANCNYTNITVLPDFNITLYFALSYKYPFDYVAVFENETDTIYYNATLLDAVILDDTANLNLLKPDGLIFIFATGAGYGLVWFGSSGQEKSYQDAYIYYVTTKLNTCYTANTTIAVYKNITLLYFGYIQQYIVLNIVIYPQVTVVISYYDVNTGLGIAFSTFKTAINDTRVYYNVLQYALYSILRIETYDYFDVLISNLTAIVNSSVTFIDIGVNLTTIYIANDRDENVTVAFESNSRNYTITLPPNYIKVVNFVARRYTVYIMSRSIGVVKFNLTATVNDNIIAIKGDKIEKIDANPQVLTIANVAQQTYINWASNGLIFGIFSTLGSFFAGLVLVHILRKRREKVVIYKTSLF